MEKLFDNEQYMQAAIQANAEGKMLYIHQHEVEYEVEVLEWEQKQIEVLVYDEEGKQTGTEKIWVDDLTKPVWTIDEETGEKIQAHHTELRTKTIQELLIANEDYYICFDENITDGTVNENYTAIRQQKFKNFFFETSLGWVKREVTMKDGSKQKFLTDVLPLLKTGIAIITYNMPDFVESDIPTQNTGMVVTTAFINECKQQELIDFYGEQQ